MARRIYLGGIYSKRCVYVDDIDYDFARSIGAWNAVMRKGEWRRYAIHHFRQKGKTCHVLLHHLIAERVLGPCPPGYTVDHINRDPKDNRRCNLRYATMFDNTSTYVLGRRGVGYIYVGSDRNPHWRVALSIKGLRGGPTRRCATENEARLIANLVRNGHIIMPRKRGTNGWNTGRRAKGRSDQPITKR